MTINYSPDREPLLKLLRETKRYSICEREPGEFDLYDDRHLLDHLLGVSELRPVAEDRFKIDFEELLESLSAGPALTMDDIGMLCWLTTTVETLNPESSNVTLDAIKAIYEGAIIFRGRSVRSRTSFVRRWATRAR
jgi:hypothetical protein